MITLDGYKITQKLHETSRTMVYRGCEMAQQRPVILKYLNKEFPTPREIARFKREYEILKGLSVAGVIRAYALEAYQNSLVLVMEDVGGVSLAKFIQANRLILADCLSLMRRVVVILGEIHQQQIMHKDINPSNILLNGSTGEVKLIDFGLSTVLSREKVTVRSPNVLEGTLAYISPEQTGRMNRAIDYRSDFYSLGVTFYQLLTGQLPFQSRDPMELVHAHLAKQPLPPAQLDPDIPAPVSDIIMKLMAKSAEERYQSSYGLLMDLDACLSQLQRGDQIKRFTLAEYDQSDRFQIHEKLYGRASEISSLLAAFERVSQGASEMMLVAGLPGIGKSALVNEMHKPITQQRGYFATGKFDQLQRNIPYSGLIHAFEDLIRQILSESEEQITIWSQTLRRALGANGQIIIDVMPEVELIVGKQEPVPELGATEAQNRFNLVFQEFINVFTRKEHPFVIFLDDVQWADLASLRLIQLMMTNLERHSFFLIAAYRDNEVKEAHPLRLTLDEIEKAGTSINEISLAPLQLAHIEELICDATGCSTQQSTALAELLLAKTHGNPFFLTQFLTSLVEEQLLCFDATSRVWQWDVGQIQQMQITDNVVEFMADKIKKLSAKTQDALQLAACIGHQFDLGTLSVLHKRSEAETAADLWQAVQEGLILPIGDAYKLIGNYEPASGEELLVAYRFLHDRVQQAAYSLIAEERKKELHLDIGRLMLQRFGKEEQIFEIVNQLNLGRQGISIPKEKAQLIRLNLLAGQKAKMAMAYQTALSYFMVGIELLPSQLSSLFPSDQGSWHNQYELTLALHVEAAEAAYLSTDMQQSERLVELVIAEARTLLDKVKVYEIRIQSYIAQNKMVAAIDTAREVLKLLGAPLPRKPNRISILTGFVRTKFVLGRKRIKHLRTLPAMADPHKLAAMRILMTTTAPAYFSSPNLLALIVFKMVQLSVKYGNSAYSAYGYNTYGVLLCARFGDINAGYKFGRFGLELLDTFNAEYIKSKVYMVFYNSVKPWKDDSREAIPYFLEGYQIGLETGDLEYAAFNAMIYCIFSFFGGRELSVVEQDMAKYGDVIRKLKQERHLHQHELIRQTLLNLKEGAQNPCLLVGTHYNETKMLGELSKVNDRTSIGILYICKSYLCTLFHAYPEAVTNALMAEKYIDALTGTMYLPMHYFYYSLALLGCYDKYSKKEQKRALKQVASNQKKMKTWADHAPSNFQEKFCLVEAERARLQGKVGQAIAYYDQALALARQYGYANQEAFANELTARFYLAQEKHKIAQLYLLEARYRYLKWGAAAKVTQMDERYPQLAQASTGSSIKQVAPSTMLISSSGSSSSSASSALDLNSVLKASQAISGEIVLDTLLEKMMKIVIENAGAQRGFLILPKNKRFYIEAGRLVDSEQIKVLQSIPIERVSGKTASPMLSNAIVHYVARSKEAVVLHDATKTGQFTRYPYMIRQQPKSVLCMPLLNRGKLSGILYLENNLTTGAFTPDRLEVLKLLSSQAAISIDNARLNKAYERFVPRQFLSLLEKESIIDVELGDQIEKEMTILFSDIRDFTAMSEEMTPAENFEFVNSYLSRMEPLIIEYHGFIDKYMGDGIMALFPTNADDAVRASIAMLQRLQQYNLTRRQAQRTPIRNGIGVHTGKLMLGTVGGKNRMDGTVISDAVNLGARVEGLTKRYGTSLLITEQTVAGLKDATDYRMREIDRVAVKGKSKAVTIYEAFDGDPAEQITLKTRTLADFELALTMYRQQEFTFAGDLFRKVWRANPQDKVAKLYITRCDMLKQHELPAEWDGVFVATTK